MASGLSDGEDCPHCPPTMMGHHGDHQTQDPCHGVEMKCDCDDHRLRNDPRVPQFKLKDSTEYVPILLEWTQQSIDTYPTDVRACEFDMVSHQGDPPLNVQFCVYLI